MTMSGSVTAGINTDILGWAKGQLAQWQHEALRRILQQGQLTEPDYLALVERAQFDLGIAVSPAALPDLTLTISDLPVPGSALGRMTLKALRNVENVNSLRTGSVLSFGPQLTVIYGENGSGKSGYARILKRVGRCASRAVEAILPNVYVSPTTNASKAILDVEVGGVARPLAWSEGKEPPAELRQISVFDSKCALSYLGADNQITFVPSVVDSIRLLSEATDEIKRRLAAVAAAAVPPYPPVLGALVQGTTNIGRTLGLLSAATDSKKLTDLGKWDTATDESALLGAQRQLAELRASGPALRQAKARSVGRSVGVLKNAIDKIVGAVGSSAIESLKQQAAEVLARSQAYDLAVASSFRDARIAGVGNDAWASLLEAAYRFSTETAYKGEPFPATSADALCVLCHQTLTTDASARLEKFWEFLKSEAAVAKNRARDTRDNTLRSMKAALAEAASDLSAVKADLEANEPNLWNGYLALQAASAQLVLAAEHAIAARSWDDLPALDFAVQEKCAERITAGTARLEAAGGDVAAESQIAAQEAQVAELAAQKRLAANLPAVQTYLEALKHHTALKAAVDSIATKALTFKAKSLYGTHVTAAFRSKVLENMQRLGLQRGGIAIEEKPAKGKVLHAIKLDGAKVAAQPSAVLSEGERTAISLSYFLADLGSTDETSVVVFDDPVTSLDHRIREGAVKALVAETKQRQVVVFTHDLAFFHEILSRAKVDQAMVVTHHVESFEQAVGLIQASTPWDALSVDERIVELQKHIARAKEAGAIGDSEGYNTQVGRFYSRLRATWERAVEEVLFNKVVSRYSKVVQTLRLQGVSIDTDSMSPVFEGITRCSAVTDAHDHATGASVPTPTVSDFTKDLDALRQFLANQKAKRKTTEKANAHLKVNP